MCSTCIHFAANMLKHKTTTHLPEGPFLVLEVESDLGGVFVGGVVEGRRHCEVVPSRHPQPVQQPQVPNQGPGNDECCFNPILVKARKKNYRF